MSSEKSDSTQLMPNEDHDVRLQEAESSAIQDAEDTFEIFGDDCVLRLETRDAIDEIVSTLQCEESEAECLLADRIACTLHEFIGNAVGEICSTAEREISDDEPTERRAESAARDNIVRERLRELMALNTR
jgi:hypothetical protein